MPSGKEKRGEATPATLDTVTSRPEKSNCPALVAKFKNYATTTDMNNVKDRLSAAEADIVMLDNSVTLMDSDIADIKNILNVSPEDKVRNFYRILINM